MNRAERAAGSRLGNAEGATGLSADVFAFQLEDRKQVALRTSRPCRLHLHVTQRATDLACWASHLLCEHAVRRLL